MTLPVDLLKDEIYLTKITFDNVLLYVDDDNLLEIGQPYLSNNTADS